MRIDAFMNATNIVKRRSIAQDMCENKDVSINNQIAKSSRLVKVGDVIPLQFLEYQKQYEVLAIPQTKSIPKSKMQDFVKEIPTSK